MGNIRADFVEQQVRGLAPLDSVAFIVRFGGGLAWVDVLRAESGAQYTVAVSAEPDLAPELLASLVDAGFGSPQPGVATRDVDSVDAVVTTTEQTLSGPLGVGPDEALDVRHASHREEVEQQRKLAAVRERVGNVLAEVVKPDGLEVDSDQDFTFAFESTRVWVSPRLLPTGLLVVRVLAVTNVAIEPTPMLGLFLAETNFTLALGRFSLDPRQQAVWFEHTLLGEHFSDDELRIVVGIVASTADQFDDRIAETFGGRVFNAPGEPAEAEAPTEKPGTGGYL